MRSRVRKENSETTSDTLKNYKTYYGTTTIVSIVSTTWGCTRHTLCASSLKDADFLFSGCSKIYSFISEFSKSATRSPHAACHTCFTRTARMPRPPCTPATSFWLRVACRSIQGLQGFRARQRARQQLDAGGKIVHLTSIHCLVTGCRRARMASGPQHSPKCCGNTSCFV